MKTYHIPVITQWQQFTLLHCSYFRYFYFFCLKSNFTLEMTSFGFLFYSVRLCVDTSMCVCSVIVPIICDDDEIVLNFAFTA